MSLGAYAHQDLPLERILEELRPEWDASRAPVFQVAFQLQNFQLPSIELKGLKLTPMTGDVGTAKFDLSMSLVETPEGLTASLEYSTDLFDAETIARMLGHYRNLLEAIVADPGARISDLALLGEAERRELLSEWNPPVEIRARAKPLHRMFEEQARRTPRSIALVCEGREMSYAELNGRANKLARHLRALGVRAESPVALCVERSAEMVVAVLAVLKAGGAYVPLDANYPAERVAFILEDARAHVLVTQRPLLQTLPAHRGRVVLLDADWPTIDRHGAEDSEGAGDADHAAYVIYTSGSTGRPKGVVVSHENVARLFEATATALRLRPLRRVDALPLLRVRLLRVGAVGRAALRRQARRRPLLGQPFGGSLPRAAERGARDRAQPDALGLPPARARRRGRGRRARIDDCGSSSSAARRWSCKVSGRGWRAEATGHHGSSTCSASRRRPSTSRTGL